MLSGSTKLLTGGFYKKLESYYIFVKLLQRVLKTQRIFARRMTYPVRANLEQACMIRRLRSLSRALYCSVMFRGWPNTYSISSPCITPIHSPHRLVLVLCPQQTITVSKKYQHLNEYTKVYLGSTKWQISTRKWQVLEWIRGAEGALR